ncbi:MAG: hypothetical protein GY751_15800 [Bacteroidetes bacterium]|nr:hypothetical protein [Bacteroidota bacterium]
MNLTYVKEHVKSTKWLSLTGGLYFLGLVIFSLVFLRERFMVDGAYMIYEIANELKYPAAQNRHIIILLDAFPLLSVLIGLPLKTVMISWVVNYVVFYAACFYIVLYVFKDRQSAWFILLTNLFLMGFGFFNIADEITPSATLAILIYSYWRHISRRPWKLKYILLAALFFFTVFGHIIVSIAVLLVISYHFLTEKYRMFTIKEFLVPGILFTVFLVMRMTSAMNDGYERSNITLNGNSLFVELATMDFQFLKDFARFYFRSFIVVAAMGLVAIIELFRRKNWKDLVFLGLLSSAYIAIWYVVIHARWGDVSYYEMDLSQLRWMFPLNFLITFIFTCLFFGNSDRLRVRWTYIVFGLTIGGQFLYLAHLSTYPRNTVTQYKAITELAHQSDGWKFYTNTDNKCPHGTYHGVYTNSMVFSAMEGPDQTVQIVFVNSEEDLQTIKTMADDSLFLKQGFGWSLKRTNTRYFRNDAANYNVIKVDYVDCDFNP